MFIAHTTVQFVIQLNSRERERIAYNKKEISPENAQTRFIAFTKLTNSIPFFRFRFVFAQLTHQWLIHNAESNASWETKRVPSSHNNIFYYNLIMNFMICDFLASEF